MTPSQLSLLWVANQPAVTAPIIGPRTPQQLDDALAILDKYLEPEVLAALDEVVPPGSAVADFHNTSGWMRMKLL
jgi:aryl-alcohol dehydrogenase-like predicted oxidoreductase